MSNETLTFSPSLPESLRQEAEVVIGSPLQIGDSFKSSDSFSYLLRSASDQYVGKVFRFKDWPNPEKIRLIMSLLDQNHIPHEEIVHIEGSHPPFIYGWQINRYVPGGTARELRQGGRLSDQDYYPLIGKLIRKVHQITISYFGSIDDPDSRYETASGFILREMKDQNYDDLPEKHNWAKAIINQAKAKVLSSTTLLDTSSAVLVHDDVNDGNVMWNNGNPILIDWTDAHAAPSIRDFATLTFREDKPILPQLESGYGQKIDREQLWLWQLVRYIKLGYFYYYEHGDVEELNKMMRRLQVLLERGEPYGV